MRYGAEPIYGPPRTLDPDKKNPPIDVDVEVQEQIVAKIRNAFPTDGIIAEEQTDTRRTKGGDSRYVWTVDPLDGTMNYLSGDDRFCCGVGLLVDGKPFMGAIYTPARMELCTGGVGRTAQCFSLANSSVKPFSSDQSVDELAGCHTITHINSDPRRLELCFENDLPRRLHQSVRRVWMWGCGLLSILSVARGGHHLFVQRITYPHDIVPGLAILEAAGGAWSTIPARASLCWDPDREHIGIVAASSDRILQACLNNIVSPRDAARQNE